MRPATALVAAGLLVALGAVVAFGITGDGSTGGTLTERWLSDTARDNRVNHHAVGVGPDGDIVVAPVAAVPNAEEITPTSCSLYRLASDTGTVRWRASLAPASCFTHALTEPAIGDLDGDGAAEVAVATTEDALIVYGAADGRERFRVPLGTYGYGRPTIGNLTPAPGPEVVAVDIEGGVVVADGDGTVLWRADRSGVVWTAPAVADADADGTPEALIATNEEVVLLEPDGTVAWRAAGRATTLADGQADDDPALEAFVTETGAVTAIDGRTGDVEWRATVEGSPRVHDVGDIDGDGRAELPVGLPSQAVVVLDAATGEEEWRTEIAAGDGAAMPPPALGDVDGDGRPEVIAPANDGTVAVLDGATGAELAAYSRPVPIWTFASVADLDDDGADEILVRYGDGRVAALAYSS